LQVRILPEELLLLARGSMRVSGSVAVEGRPDLGLHRHLSIAPGALRGIAAQLRSFDHVTVAHNPGIRLPIVWHTIDVRRTSDGKLGVWAETHRDRASTRRIRHSATG
jgi:hypothetical protein